MKHCLLVEFYPYHSECLYSQIIFLQRSGYKVSLAIDTGIEPLVSAFGLTNISIHCYQFSKLSSYLCLRKLISTTNFHAIIFNTISGNRPFKYFLLPFSAKKNMVGVIHETHKLLNSMGQKFIARKVKKYYVLAEYIHNTFPKIDNIEHTYFSTGYYPNYPDVTIRSKGDELWASVPGAIEYKRRDYDALIELALHSELCSNVRFVLLCNSNKGDGEIFMEKVRNAGVEHRFVVFTERLEDAIFQTYIKHSDLLLPLLHESASDIEHYRTSKISGMFPLSEAYCVPMLCDKSFASIDGFSYPAFFYDGIGELVKLLNEYSRWEGLCSHSFEKERKRYVSLINEL